MADRKYSLDVLAALAVAVATVGLTLAFYRLVGSYEEGSVAVGISGWHYGTGLIGWAFVIAAAVGTWMRAGPDGWSGPGRVIGFLTTGAACAAVATAVVAIVRVPDGEAVAAAAYQHISRDELLGIATEAAGWMPTGSHVELGLGPFLLLVSALLVLGAGAGSLRGALGRGGADTRSA